MSLRDLIEDIAPPAREFVVSVKTGQVRQAGADQSNGKYVTEFRSRAEQSLYVFAKGVLGLSRLTTDLHKPVCRWLTKIPPYRKLLLLPRDHLKTSILARALPMHVIVQPKDANIYVPGRDGASLRILITGEAAVNAQKQLRWIATKFESNAVLRAFWPHKLWEGNPRLQSKVWNTEAILLPREEDYPEATIETIGVGGAITGRHFNVIVKDDLTTFEAANSPTVMQTAIEWHEAARDLFDDPEQSLEFISGTRWAVYDLPQHIIDHDPTVEVLKRSVIEDGKPIFPVGGDGKKLFTLDVIDRLKKSRGVMFPLLYMNEAADPTLTDFRMEDIREFQIVGSEIEFEEDERDILLAARQKAPVPQADLLRGRVATREQWGELWQGRGEFLRARYG